MNRNKVQMQIRVYVCRCILSMSRCKVASMERSGIEEINVQKPRFRVTPSRLLAFHSWLVIDQNRLSLPDLQPCIDNQTITVSAPFSQTMVSKSESTLKLAKTWVFFKQAE